LIDRSIRAEVHAGSAVGPITVKDVMSAAGVHVQPGVDDDDPVEAEAIRAEGLDPDDPAVRAAPDLVRSELELPCPLWA
jgi:hypothetical protein